MMLLRKGTAVGLMPTLVVLLRGKDNVKKNNNNKIIVIGLECTQGECLLGSYSKRRCV
jgi:hypothetical protein